MQAAAAFGANLGQPLFVPTGAVGRFGPSEASVMRRLLIADGVAPDRILPEETGTDTLSSVRAVRRLLRARAYVGPVYAASSGYHLPRCVLLLRLAGLRARAAPPPPSPAASSMWKRWYWRGREVLAIPYDAALVLALRCVGRL